jgi:peptidoglycan/xylan/chitin deacetylase (PgdA/CDA1 family)
MQRDSLVDENIQDLSLQNGNQEPLILNTWDSLRKGQLVLQVDSIHPVDVKTQKRLLKDSLRKEFDKHPKHIFLTFDDGPLVGSAVIDSLARARKIKVSTFLVGRHADMGKNRKRDLERYRSNPYVACYNHSYTHGLNKFSAFYNNPTSAFADFEKNEADLKLEHKIVRMPGRNVWIYDDIRRIDMPNSTSTADLLHNEGYKIYGWDIEWRIQSNTGVPTQPLEQVRTRVRNFMGNKSSMTPNNVVLLMHDDMFQTQNGKYLLIQLLDGLTEDGYRFEFMEDYPIKY